MDGTRFLVWATLIGLAAMAVATAAVSDDRIRPHAANPRYWQYRGKPVLLLGGTSEDNLFQVEGLEAQLDLLESVGGNYVRNTMSSRDPGNVWPFRRGEDGRYDLNQLDPVYFDRFERLVRLANERHIIVQIEMWDRFDFARDPWRENPYRPANNLNYTTETSGLKNDYPRHPGTNDNPFFRSVPERDNNELILGFQQKQVDRLLEISFKYPNVLYCMDNETAAHPAWGAYWSGYIEQKAVEAGVEVQTTEMWDAWDLRSGQHRNTLDHPERYSFADVSQNNHKRGQTHWDNFQWARGYVAENPRPLNHVKIYGADGGKFGNTRDAVERFWRCILGGGASARFHRPSAGIGLSETAQANLKSARLFLDAFDLFLASPDAQGQTLADAGPNEAYVSCVDGKQYAVYFPNGGAVRLALPKGMWRFRWLDIADSRWRDPETLEASDGALLSTPAEGHWIALVTAD